MDHRRISRRTVVAGAVGFAASMAARRASAQQKDPLAPPELIEAAKKEGSIVYYTANFAEVEQEVIKAFNKRFPFVKVESETGLVH